MASDHLLLTRSMLPEIAGNGLATDSKAMDEPSRTTAPCLSIGSYGKLWSDQYLMACSLTIYVAIVLAVILTILRS